MTNNELQSFDAIALHDNDSVATVIQSLQAGTIIRVQRPSGVKNINLRDDVPLCHKVAIKTIEVGEAVRKNGQIIGHATKQITTGRHVHIHNIVGRNPAECL